MRNRTRSSETPELTHEGLIVYDSFRDGIPWTGPTDRDVVTTSRRTTSEQETNDIVIENFQARRNRGEIFNNPFYSEKTEVIETPLTIGGHVSYYDLYDPAEVERRYTVTQPFEIGLLNRFALGTSVTQPAVAEPDYDTIKERVVTQAFSQLNDPTAMLPVTIAEGEKTVAMFLNIHRALKKADKLIKRGVKLRKQLAVAGGSVAVISANYLQVRYGLRPLYYEIKGYVDVMSKWANEITRTRYRAFYRDTETTKAAYTQTLSLDNATEIPFDMDLVTDVVRTYQVSGGVLCRAIRKNRDRAYQLGLHSYLSSVWELIPYSFVVDWFFNTADLVSSYDPVLEVEPLTWWNSMVETTEYTTYIKALYPKDRTSDAMGIKSQSIIWSGGAITTRVEKRVRVPTPTRQVLPSVNIRLTSFKIADLLALVISGLKGSQNNLRSSIRV